MMGMIPRSNDPAALMSTVGQVSGVVGGISIAMIIVGLIGKKAPTGCGGGRIFVKRMPQAWQPRLTRSRALPHLDPWPRIDHHCGFQSEPQKRAEETR